MSCVLLFGEVLFDIFEDGEHVLGGAPFNVAWHLKGLGLHPFMVSRLGHDDLAQQVLRAMQSWQMETQGLQQDTQHATGCVQVSVNQQGIPHFDIIDQVAYDFIQIPDSLPARKIDLLYHGSLALRHATSHNSLFTLRKKLDCPVFIDLNIRQPWWDSSTLPELLTSATWLKLNDEELASLFAIDEPDNRARLQEAAQQLRHQYQLDAVIVTCGTKGAFIVTEQDIYTAAPVIVDTIVDTVGAGDSFSAIVIKGLLANWDYPTILQHATAFAARVCQLKGAITMDTDFYHL